MMKNGHSNDGDMAKHQMFASPINRKEIPGMKVATAHSHPKK